MSYATIFTLIFACFQALSISGTEPLSVHPPFIEVVANPSKFDGKLVTVRGYLDFLHDEHNMVMLWVYEEDSRNLLNGIQVLPSKEMLRGEEKINQMYVTLTAMVKNTPVANGGGVATVLEDVRGCVPWSDPRHPRHPIGDKAP